MTPKEIQELLSYLTPEEREELDKLIAADPVPWRPLPGPQSMAYYTLADVLGYGGAAGGGKTDLIAGLILTAHERSLVARREKAQTEGLVQRVTEILGDSKGMNSQKGIWTFSPGKLMELAGLDNEGDEHRFQGRPHDLKAFDEVTEQRERQVRFLMGWRRSSRAGQRTRVVMTFNPPTTAEGRWVIDYYAPWLDPAYPIPADPGELRYFAMVAGKEVEVPDQRQLVVVNGKPEWNFDPADFTPQDIITPQSRTFIPSRVTDNPYYMATGYMATLQALPEPLRSQMLYGDFTAGIKDDAWQVIPTEWVDAAMRRWKKRDVKPMMDSLGVDVARGGDDSTVISRRHGYWYDELLAYPGKQTPDGPAVMGVTVKDWRNRAPIHIDVIGVGSSPYDFMKQAGLPVYGVNVAVSAPGTDKSGALTFANLRSFLVWRLREQLDPANGLPIELPPDRRLAADLCAFTWTPRGKEIYVHSREEVFKKIQRSPDYAVAVFLASMDTPRVSDITGMRNAPAREHDPYANLKP